MSKLLKQRAERIEQELWERDYFIKNGYCISYLNSKYVVLKRNGVTGGTMTAGFDLTTMACDAIKQMDVLFSSSTLQEIGFNCVSDLAKAFEVLIERARKMEGDE